jgi:hypothetical protein
MDVETEELILQTKLQANRHVQIPTDIFEAEQALSVFDCSSVCHCVGAKIFGLPL